MVSMEKVQFNRNIAAAISIAFLLSACSSHKPLLYHWSQPYNPSDTLYPKHIAFGPYNQALWIDINGDTLYFRYSQLRDTLRIQDSEGNNSLYKVQFPNHRLLCISPLKGKAAWPCLQRGKKVARKEQFANPNQYEGREKLWQDIVPALRANTVEQRLKNLLLLFKEDDYIITPTIERLTVLPPESTEVKDMQALEAQQNIIAQIAKITRKGSHFIMTLKNGDFEAPIPIYEQENGQRQLKGLFRVSLKNGAYAKIMGNALAVNVDIEGVKLGKGWLMIGIPSLQINGDWGNMLGFRFYLSR